MSHILSLAFRWGLVAVFLLLGSLEIRAQTKDVKTDAAPAKEMKFEVQLVWATTNKVTSDSKHKPVAAETQKKLDKLQLKWVNYFEISQKHLTVLAGKKGELPVSDKCTLEVTDLGKKIQVIWLGKKGNEVGKQTQPLRKGELLILGGNAPGASAWFIILKRVE